uniref:ZF-HD dimerization-type domain-containing protein n=1 Tax=Nelumbo nucifera TaxID=4432 RepID=A0A822Y8I6_NELNU|nr:TPA_asm: hypothetical protein HUJ06_029077 [Nelumbo nucifera]
MRMLVLASYESLGNLSRDKVAGTGGDGASFGKNTINKYREWLKNHAVSIRGHVIDGCGDFMAAREEGTLDTLKCATCKCHRNFHRKETEGEVYHHQFSPYYRTPMGYLHVALYHRPLALPLTSGGGGGAQSREDQEDVSNPVDPLEPSKFKHKRVPKGYTIPLDKPQTLKHSIRRGGEIKQSINTRTTLLCSELVYQDHDPRPMNRFRSNEEVVVILNEKFQSNQRTNHRYHSQENLHLH